MKKNSLCLFFFPFLFASFSWADIRDDILPESQNEALAMISKQRYKDLLSEKEQDDLSIYLMVKGAINGGSIPKGVKIRDAIKEQHEYDESERLAKENAKSVESLEKRSVIIKNMSKLINVSLVRLDFKPKDYYVYSPRGEFYFEASFKNNTNENIRVSLGKFIFKDTSGKMIKSVMFMQSLNVPMASSVIKKGIIGYNSSRESDQKLRDMIHDGVIMEWEPNTYILESDDRIKFPSELSPW